jgi:hypothetical protein
MTAPLGKTTFGATVWRVSAGRTPGQQTGLEHFTWGGSGDAIHLHRGGISDGQVEQYGADTGTVSGLLRQGAMTMTASADRGPRDSPATDRVIRPHSRRPPKPGAMTLPTSASRGAR